MDIFARIAQELNVNDSQVVVAVNLLDEGSTVPFIARYRKEATGGLDDGQLRLLEERLIYLRELEERRAVVLSSIQEQGKLTPELEADINAADTKVRLEDLYRPYIQKRRTKAQLAREAGLEPLALMLLADPTLDPETSAASYFNEEKAITTVEAALDGARHILMEKFSEDAELLAILRDFVWEHGRLYSKVLPDKETQGAKFKDYFDNTNVVNNIPSHRVLAMLRGQRSGILQLKLLLDEAVAENAEGETLSQGERMLMQHIKYTPSGRAADPWLQQTIKQTWRSKLYVYLDLDVKRRLRENADTEAIKVFAHNLHDLLLASPAGPRPSIGLDPGIRTGVKVAVIDGTGKLQAITTLYPFPPKNQKDAAIAELANLAKNYGSELIAIGNGTASRETEAMVSELLKLYPELNLTKLVVSEAGASVYSASELAAQELPDTDVSLRGAVSIARRLQDPLAELVKIEPKSIGVGQYQHDVSQVQLSRALENVVEDCVNAVGVDVNTASIALLARISGLNSTLAENIVTYRNEHGPFQSREEFLKVPRIGPKTFEQAAGFLRINSGANPLDASAVHPEAYQVVERIVAKTGKTIKELISNSEFLRELSPLEFIDDQFGEPTVRDIIAELEKPGRDPRPEFKTAQFREGVEKISDLQAGMILEGMVTNVTNFGAFVDIGVHQDGLVHISHLSNKFVTDPRTIVKTGEIVKVIVVEVDQERNRIALSMRLDGPRAKPEKAEPAKAKEQPREQTRRKKPARKPEAKHAPQSVEQPPHRGAMADQLEKLKIRQQR